MAFNEALHARGTGAQGGQFVSKGGARTSSIGYNAKGRSGSGYGDKGGDANVKRLQRELNRLGITDSSGNQLEVDGKFGPKTTAAVRRLQKRLGMEANGKVTPELLERLKKMQPSRHDKHMMHARHQATKAGKQERTQRRAENAQKDKAARQARSRRRAASAAKKTAPARKEA